eukprot:5387862-Pleurochrysis_carterae.AAC.5
MRASCAEVCSRLQAPHELREGLSLPLAGAGARPVRERLLRVWPQQRCVRLAHHTEPELVGVARERHLHVSHILIRRLVHHPFPLLQMIAAQLAEDALAFRPRVCRAHLLSLPWP